MDNRFREDDNRIAEILVLDRLPDRHHLFLYQELVEGFRLLHRARRFDIGRSPVTTECAHEAPVQQSEITVEGLPEASTFTAGIEVLQL